jgi:hypothetical protein
LGMKTMAFITSASVFGVLALAGVITFEFWKGRRDAKKTSPA